MLIWLTPLQMSLYGGLAVLAALAVRTAGRRRAIPMTFRLKKSKPDR